ncbi:uncharacterized protein PAC_05345 [Phialocephala subalpina]|uniref:Uncharacterized protein n=1 Tax=Phialocephala subalpina TaxID=576137 RepID=A0A1L7WRS3_9HELO|nr:uncharacterized protein PAC_05345 [Phialocephala subalpina]
MTCPAVSTLPTSLLNNVALIAGSQGQVPVMLALDNCCLQLTAKEFKWSANNCYHYCNITSLSVTTSMNTCIHDKLGFTRYDFIDYDWAFPNDYGFTLPVNTKAVPATLTDTGGIIIWVNPGGNAPTQYINSPMIFFPESTAYNHAPSTSTSDTPKTTSLSSSSPKATASLLESQLSHLILGPGNAIKTVTSQSTSVRAATGTTITLLASSSASSTAELKGQPVPAVGASGTTSTGSVLNVLPAVLATGTTSAGTGQSSSVGASMSMGMVMSSGMSMPVSSGSSIISLANTLISTSLNVTGTGASTTSFSNSTLTSSSKTSSASVSKSNSTSTTSIASHSSITAGSSTPALFRKHRARQEQRLHQVLRSHRAGTRGRLDGVLGSWLCFWYWVFLLEAVIETP